VVQQVKRQIIKILEPLAFFWFTKVIIYDKILKLLNAKNKGNEKCQSKNPQSKKPDKIKKRD
jgi:hypothetical protein